MLKKIPASAAKLGQKVYVMVGDKLFGEYTVVTGRPSQQSNRSFSMLVCNPKDKLPDTFPRPAFLYVKN